MHIDTYTGSWARKLLSLRTYYALVNADLHNMLDVWVPDSQTPVRTPILYMVGGMGGLLPGVAYDTIFSR